MEIGKSAIHKNVAILLVAALAFLILIPFMLALRQASIWYRDAEQRFEKRYLADVSSQFLSLIADTTRLLEEDAREAAEILETVSLNEEKADAQLRGMHPKPEGLLIFDSEGRVRYGDRQRQGKFRRIAELALISGQSGSYGAQIDDTDRAELGVACPFVSKEGKQLVLVLVYDWSVLGLRPETLHLDYGSLALIEDTGGLIFQSASHPPDSTLRRLALRSYETGVLLSLPQESNGLSYMAYISQTDIKDWRLILTTSREQMSSLLPAENTDVYLYGLVTSVLMAGFILASTYLALRQNRQMTLFQKKFRIATRQSARAAYEYNKRTDSLKLISESDHVILPKPRLSLKDLGDVVHPADFHLFTYAVNSLRNQDTASVTLRLLNFDGKGSYRWYTVTGTRLTAKGDGSAITIGTVEDIDERENERLLLYSRATTDCLTGLRNRAETENLVSARLGALGGGDRGAFAILDLDSFKVINDICGHDCGDKALISFSSKLRDIFNQGEILGRLGGDEFMVYIPDACDPQEIRRRFEAFASSISGIRVSNQPEISGLACSVGCCYARSGDSFEQIYRCADAALYEAKSLQTDKFIFREA